MGDTSRWMVCTGKCGSNRWFRGRKPPFFSLRKVWRTTRKPFQSFKSFKIGELFSWHFSMPHDTSLRFLVDFSLFCKVSSLKRQKLQKSFPLDHRDNLWQLFLVRSGFSGHHMSRSFIIGSMNFDRPYEPKNRNWRSSGMTIFRMSVGGWLGCRNRVFPLWHPEIFRRTCGCSTLHFGSFWQTFSGV